MYKKCFYVLSILYLISFKVSVAETSLTTLTKISLAPDFQLIDMDDKKHRLSDYRGKPVIINFWASWCPPCREELPSMNRAWKKINQQGIIMLAVNVGEDDETIFSFLGDYPIDFTVLLDQNGEVTAKWPIKGLPTTFVINPQGYIVYRAIGGRAWDDDRLLDKVRGLRKRMQK